MPLNDVSKGQSEFALSETIGNQPIGKLLFRFSLPGVISMLVGATYNIVDTIYVGKLGHKAIAALTVVFPIQLIIVAASAGIGVGAASLISRRLGEKRSEDANRIVGQALGLSVVMGLLVAALIYFVEHPLLRLMGASDLIVKDAYDYIRIIMLGNVFSLIGPVGSNMLRAAGNVRRPMNSMIAGALANIALDPIFIYTLKMGVKGAAIATVISQVIVCFAILTFLFGPRTQFQVKALSFIPSMKFWWRILSVGGPQMVMTLVGSLSMAIAVKIASPFGEASVAAYGVIFRITQFGFMPASGITSAAMPIIGYNFGAKKILRVRETLRKTIISTTVITAGVSVFSIFSPRSIVSLFNRDPEFLPTTVHAVRIGFLCFALLGAQISFASFFQGIGKGHPAGVIGITRQLAIFVPAVIFLSKILGQDGLWIALPLADLGAFTVAIIWAGILIYRLKIKI